MLTGHLHLANQQQLHPSRPTVPLVAASLEAGASVSAVAREAGIHAKPTVWLAAPAAFAGAIELCAGPGRVGSSTNPSGSSRSDRDRACSRSADAHQGRSTPQPFDGDRGTGRWSAAMIPIAPGVRVWIATGHTDMRRGMNSLALLVQEVFKRNPHDGDPYSVARAAS